MGVSEAFTVAKGGFTTLAGKDRNARATVGALRRELAAVTDRMNTAEPAERPAGGADRTMD